MKSRSGQLAARFPACPPGAAGILAWSGPGWPMECADTISPAAPIAPRLLASAPAGGARLTGADSHSSLRLLTPELSVGSVTPLTSRKARGRLRWHGRPRPARDSRRLDWTFPRCVLVVLHA